MVRVPFLVDLLSKAREVEVKRVTCPLNTDALTSGVRCHQQFDRLCLDVGQVEIRPVNSADDEGELLVVIVGDSDEVTHKEFAVLKRSCEFPVVDDHVVNEVLLLGDLDH